MIINDQLIITNDQLIIINYLSLICIFTILNESFLKNKNDRTYMFKIIVPFYFLLIIN